MDETGTPLSGAWRWTDTYLMMKWIRLEVEDADNTKFDTGELEVHFSLVSKTQSREDITKLWKAFIYFSGRRKSAKGLVAELNDNREDIITDDGEEEEAVDGNSTSSGKGDSEVGEKVVVGSFESGHTFGSSEKSDETEGIGEEEGDEDYMSAIEEADELNKIVNKTAELELVDKKLVDVKGIEFAVSAENTPITSVSTTPQKIRVDDNEKSKPRRKRKHRRQKSYELNVYSDIVGMAFLELVSVSDLPAPKNMTRTSFDMDPFVVVSFGKKTFRTPYKRHTLNPVYNERLLFPIQRNEKGFSLKFMVMDNDKLTLHDFVADAELNVKELLINAPVPDPETGLYDPMLKDSVLSEADVRSFILPLRLMEKYGTSYSPKLTVRAKFVPYAALRQQLWRSLITQYASEETKTLDSIRLNTVLDTLGSTLLIQTRMQFFQRFNKDFETDELTIDEAITCLEEQIIKDTEYQQRRIMAASDMMDSDSGSSVGGLDGLIGSSTTSLGSYAESFEHDAFDMINGPIVPGSQKNIAPMPLPSSLAERVIRLNACPICKQPRLSKRSEVDLVSHVATCASLNWEKVDVTLLDRFITSTQARSRWYTSVVKKVSFGNYKLGANSANILVQDRETGFVMEEKMSIYVRVGIRLLYKGITSTGMETKRIRALLKSLSVKQGRKYDSPSSVQSIMSFIKFHNLDMSEALEPIEKFSTFNQFFYRKLKPGVRQLDAPAVPRIAVSPADCRCTVFPSVTKAQQVWIKGRPFSIKRLLGEQYSEYVPRFVDGPLAIFRLAPQDYHRFHSPVNGVVGKPKLIEGEYYTVNPMAIRSSLDVFGENVRVLVPIESREFGSVMVVAVGAMMVGSTVITAKEGDTIRRMDELGYFQFGGSTLVVLFEPGRVLFDRDLEENSCQPLETLVRVGMSIGHSPSVAEWERNDLKSPELASPEQLQRARRVISGLPD